MKRMFIDPPSGWKYGFPKPAPNNIRNMTKKELNEWFIQNGYPETEISRWGNKGIPFGMFEMEENE